MRLVAQLPAYAYIAQPSPQVSARHRRRVHRRLSTSSRFMRKLCAIRRGILSQIHCFSKAFIIISHRAERLRRHYVGPPSSRNHRAPDATSRHYLSIIKCAGPLTHVSARRVVRGRYWQDRRNRRWSMATLSQHCELSYRRESKPTMQARRNLIKFH